MRSHLTYANVMATLAVFLVLGGGTALAAYVISSNSQIGPGTVSGHKPPSGKHANIILGSISSGDLALGAVNQRRLAPRSVSTDKFAPGATAPEAAKVDKLHVTSAARSKAQGLAGQSGTGSLISLSVGDSVVLYSTPTFTLTAKCTNWGNGMYRVAEYATSPVDGWWTGAGPSSGAEEHSAGDDVLLYSFASAGSESSGGGPTYVAAPGGESLSIAGPMEGIRIVGADCVLNQYAIG